ncbi:hypothetical protein J6590_023066 [Homalodisca vitripennis]|nr:hypothetical protein J6590_023066 [Homalodisca vitripennis]
MIGTSENVEILDQPELSLNRTSSRYRLCYRRSAPQGGKHHIYSDSSTEFTLHWLHTNLELSPLNRGESFTRAIN